MDSKKNIEDTIDLNYWWRTALSHWWWFAVSVVLMMAIAFVYIKRHPAEYMTQSNILSAEDNSASFTAMSGIDDLFGSSANAEDDQYIIASHSVLVDAVRALNFEKTHYVKHGLIGSTLAYPDFPVDVYLPKGLADTLNVGISFKINLNKDGKADIVAKAKRDKIADVEDVTLPATLKTDYGDFVVAATKYCPKDKDVNTTITVGGYDMVAENFAKSITYQRASKRSNVIELYYVGPNPDYNKALLNEIVLQYNIRDINRRNEQGRKTAQFLDDRIALISGDLSEAEANIQNYKQAQGISDVSAEASYNMAKRSAAEHSLVEAQTRYEILKFTRDFIADPVNKYELIPVNAITGEAGAAISSYNGLIMARTNLLKNARGNNKALQNNEEQLAMMRQSIDGSLESALRSSQISINEARQQLSKSQGGLSGIPKQERQFLDLKRQQEVKQQLYLFLLQRREETAMLLANAIAKGYIVDKAYTYNEPVSMGAKKVALIFLLIGLFIPCLLLYLRYLLHNKFENSDELRRITDTPILGEISTSRSGENLVVGTEKTSSVAELFRALRSNIDFMLKSPNDKVILVTSTKPAEGKSFVSLNLAATMALVGKRVVLIGMDIRNPRLAQYLGMANTRGLTTYLSNEDVTPESIIQPYPEMSSLDVIVAGPIPPNPGELLTSPRLSSLIDYLRKRYDYIVIDSAPVGMVSDTFNISSLADTTVYVTRANFTTKADIRFMTRNIADGRLKNVAVVVNGTKAKARYGYGYSAKTTE